MVNTITQLTERNKELVARIAELENNKNTEIKKYEYSLKRSLIKRTPEEHLIRENEILSKIVLEILLRFSKKQFSGSQKTTEEINELLSQPDWREKAQFEVGDYQYKEENEVDECIGHSKSCPWLISAREPIEIIENLKKDNEETITNLTDYHFEQLEKKDKEISELEQKVKELQIKQEEQEELVEELEERVEIEQEEAMKALDKSDEWHKRKVFELGMKEYSRITELRLKIQELENTLEVKNEKITKLSKPAKLQKVRKSVKAIKEKVHTKVHKVMEKAQEKLCAYVLQSNILQKNK